MNLHLFSLLVFFICILEIHMEKKVQVIEQLKSLIIYSH